MAAFVTYEVHECYKGGMVRFVGKFDTWERAKSARNGTKADKAWVMRVDNHPFCPAECRATKWGHTWERNRP